MKRLPRTLGWSIKFLIACTLGACAPYSDLCIREMDCRGGNDADVDACVIEYERREERSDLNNCGDFLSRYLDCYDVQVGCNSKVWTDKGDCSDEAKDFFDCID